MNMESDRTFEVEIERLLPGGVGLAHAEGLTLFVSLAAPGDVVRIAIDRVQGKVAFASIVEILTPSPVRIEPPCPYFGRCGGCDFQQLTYDAQLSAKVEIIRDCLHRIAKIEPAVDVSIVPSPDQWHYRARAMWQVDAADPNAPTLGYFERGTNRVCDVEYCAVLTPELQATLEGARTSIRAGDIPERLRDIEAVAGEAAVSVSPAIGGYQTEIVSRAIGDETYHFSAEAFFQINHGLLVQLIEEAMRTADAGPNIGGADDGLAGAGETKVRGETAIDLYSGVGLFTLPMARRFNRVIAVEGSARATHFARRNLELANRRGGDEKRPDLGDVEILTARVGEWLKHHSGSFGPVDFLLLDPPRTGCENRDIAGILALHPAQITYVSCDPATLARDLKKLIGGGFTLDSVKAFDMFPQTHHVETVAHLARAN
jgi:23S rRNA (uracil1939-C5)-methyltransferase